MLSTNEPSDSDSETDMESMFKIRYSSDEVFYFESMTIQHDEKQSTTVVFTFSFSQSTEFQSILKLNKTIPIGQFDSSLFSIGVCALTWFWMGYATKKIVIKPG